MKTVTVQEMKAMIDGGEDFQLIDVREQNEFDFVNLKGELIPMSVLAENIDKFERDKKVIVHCRSGARSGNAIMMLQQDHGYDNLYNLTGGILAWAKEIDNSMPTY